MRPLHLLAVLLLGCHSAPQTMTASAQVSSPVEVSAPPQAPGLLFSLERGACFGRCPIYKVEVLTDGSLRFKGERHVAVTEPVELTLAPGTLEQLTARLERSGFDTWGDFTRHQVTDMATVVLTWKGKTVRHYLGDEKAPPQLTQLETDLDLLLGTARWVTGEGALTQ